MSVEEVGRGALAAGEEGVVWSEGGGAVVAGGGVGGVRGVAGADWCVLGGGRQVR